MAAGVRAGSLLLVLIAPLELRRACLFTRVLYWSHGAIAPHTPFTSRCVCRWKAYHIKHEPVPCVENDASAELGREGNKIDSQVRPHLVLLQTILWVLGMKFNVVLRGSQDH